MKQQKTDRRSQRTYRLVSSALAELLREKPYDEILDHPCIQFISYKKIHAKTFPFFDPTKRIEWQSSKKRSFDRTIPHMLPHKKDLDLLPLERGGTGAWKGNHPTTLIFTKAVAATNQRRTNATTAHPWPANMSAYKRERRSCDTWISIGNGCQWNS